jgi:hypothetical protein
MKHVAMDTSTRWLACTTRESREYCWDIPGRGKGADPPKNVEFEKKFLQTFRKKNPSNYMEYSRFYTVKRLIILDADFSTPSVLLFSQIRIIPIFDLVKFRKLLLLINILTNPSAPSSFKKMFKFLSSIQQRALTIELAHMTFSPPSRVLTLVNEHFCTVLPFFLIA